MAVAQRSTERFVTPVGPVSEAVRTMRSAEREESDAAIQRLLTGQGTPQPEKANPGGWSDEEIEKFADLEFEPWPDDKSLVPTSEAWLNPYLVSLRLAFSVLTKTKPELVTVADNLGEDGTADLLDRLHHAEEALSEYAKMLGAAHSRLLCAGTVLSLREGL